MADEGRGVVLITHDIDLAVGFADRVAVFYAGTTVETAPAADFQRGEDALRHPYSKALWRALPQNGFQPVAGHQPYAGSLPEGCLWEAGDDRTQAGQPFIANMPTEEIFTAPLREGIDGVVYASLPLSHEGNIVDKFWMKVERGRIVEVHAQVGEETLRHAVTVDEGASYFGEVALVPYDSPIRSQNILFYNTLFDENAACHLAFGEAYPECIQGGAEMDKEALKAHGLNDSITHVDFMVGTSDLSIVGTAYDGREIPVFADGNFAL